MNCAFGLCNLVNSLTLSVICSYPDKMDCPEVTASVVQPYIHTFIQEQTYVQAPSYIHTQIYQSYTQEQIPECPQNVAQYSPVHTSPYHQQGLHKKGSLRKEDVIKRNRVQTMWVIFMILLFVVAKNFVNCLTYFVHIVVFQLMKHCRLTINFNDLFFFLTQR